VLPLIAWLSLPSTPLKTAPPSYLILMPSNKAPPNLDQLPLSLSHKHTTTTYQELFKEWSSGERGREMLYQGGLDFGTVKSQHLMHQEVKSQVFFSVFFFVSTILLSLLFE